MKRSIRRTARLAGGLIPVAILAGVLSAPSGAMAGPGSSRSACGSAWRLVGSPSPGTLANGLDKIIALSPTDAWAVGSKLHGEIETSALVERYDGSAWSEARSPLVDEAALLDVDGTSARDVWAVGTVWGVGRILIEHYDGSRWTRVSAPMLDTDYVQLGAVDAISPMDVWAAGYFLDRATGVYRNLVSHYDGVAWSLVEAPALGRGDNQLFDLAAVNADNVWVVGHAFHQGRFHPLAMPFTGRKWRVVTAPDGGSGDSSLYAIAAGPNGTMRAVGSGTDGTGVARTLAEYYRDSAWIATATPNASAEENELWSVAISPEGDVWAVGDYNPHSLGQTLTEHLCP